MPKNNFSGGTSIFPTTIRPSIFNPLPASEMLSRKGEKFIWLRAMPTPDLSQGQLALPDSSKGYIYTFEDYFHIPEEAAIMGGIEGNRIKTRYGNIARVNRVWIPKDEMAGTPEEFSVKSFSGNEIEIESTQELRYWDNVFIDYDFLLYDTFETRITLGYDTDSYLVAEDKTKILIKFSDFWYRLPGELEYTREPVTHDYYSVYFGRVFPSGTELIMNYDLYTPIDLVYKTINLKDIEESKLPVGAQEGDLEVIVGETVKLSKGDILISTLSYGVEKEISQFDPGKGFSLKRNPIVEIIQVISNKRKYERNQFRLINKRYIVLDEKPENMPKNISVVYTYNPSFRVASSQEYSGLSGRTQLRQYVVKPDSTNIVLSEIK